MPTIDSNPHAPDHPTPRAEIGVIGGSGLYTLLEDATTVPVTTPYGDPSESLVIGTVGGRSVAFLPRHGQGHRYPAHRINYRANLWALRSVGVRQILGPCAVGSLRPELGPGSLVIPDQLVDRTSGRIQTYYDEGAVHLTFSDPYCSDGRQTVVKVAGDDWNPVDGGTMVVIEGPRFSTRSESRWYAEQGWSLVNMTGHPEAVLARELAMCYTAIALVTDLDAGLAEGQGVSQDEVFAAFGRNVERLRQLLFAVIPRLPARRTCACAGALDGMQLPFALPD